MGRRLPRQPQPRRDRHHLTRNRQPKKPKPAPPGRNQTRPSGANFMPVRIFDNAAGNIENGQKHPATLSGR
uniref:Uncharacterized protein n=1 Tax=Siphoviridae sp. ctBeL15 TaxID=2825374 RepID=A0A8S5V040_9CAUD|nr:MAG TPA: hypothetical protein [Siphoviridae sp. ctBeL15]